MKFEISSYKENSAYCNIEISWVGPLVFKCYIKKEHLGSTIEYLHKNESEIYNKLLALQDELHNAVSSEKSED